MNSGLTSHKQLGLKSHPRVIAVSVRFGKNAEPETIVNTHVVNMS